MERDGDSSSFILCAQLSELAGMELVEMPVDLVSMSCGLRFTGWGAMKIPVDSFYLLS